MKLDQMPTDTARRHIMGARRYAAADRSDPFAFSRAVAHLKQGLGGYSEHGQDIGYDAEPTTETRAYMKNGERVEYEVTTFRNAKRI